MTPGLAGIAHLEGEPKPLAERLERMCRLQAHRRRAPVRTLNTARLAVATGGLAQDSGLTLALDGQILNRAALRAELGRAGVVPASQEDAALLLAGYRAWGERCFERVHGAFACVIHEEPTGRTLLVRDPYGVKPLLYAQHGGAVYFASEAKTLLALGAPATPNRRALLEWALYGDVLPPETLFEGVRSVPPGHLLQISPAASAPRLREYYHLTEHVDPARYASFGERPVGEMLDEIDRVVERCIEECLDAPEPVGVMLSGGVDSAIITAIAARKKPITAFHLSIPDDPRMDERRMAEEVARVVGVPLVTLPASRAAFSGALTEVIYRHEMPLWHMQCAGFYLLVQRAVQEGTSVLLVGDSIGGCLGLERGRHAAVKWLAPAARLLKGPLAPSGPAAKLLFASARLPVSRGGLVANFPFVLNLIDGFRRSRLLEDCEQVYGFITDPVQRRIMAAKLADQNEWRPRFAHRGDRLAAAHSAEYRNPISDPDATHFWINLPYALFERGRTRKWALKEVALRYLPRHVTHQRKIAWDLPAHLYLEPFARRELFQDGFCAEFFGLPAAQIDALVADWRGAVPLFFRLLQIELWGRLFLLGDSPERLNERALRPAADFSHALCPT